MMMISTKAERDIHLHASSQVQCRILSGGRARSRPLSLPAADEEEDDDDDGGGGSASILSTFESQEQTDGDPAPPSRIIRQTNP